MKNKPDKDPILAILSSTLPTSPNYASTFLGSGERKFDPISYSKSITTKQLKDSLRELFLSQSRYQLESQSEQGLHFIYTSALLRFKDDIYLWIDDSSRVIHLLSKSRVGYSDFEANTKRLKELTELIKSHSL